MSSQTPPPGGGDPSQPSFAEENALRIASESLTHYDQASDTYHCSYGPPVPAVTVHDPERGLLVRVEPRSRQVVGFSIPDFKAWYAANVPDGGEFEVDLPSVWPLEGEGPGAGDDPSS
jgi:hypothetical protein